MKENLVKMTFHCLVGVITCDNALHYLNAGASHVIVTSFVFKDGEARIFHVTERSFK